MGELSDYIEQQESVGSHDSTGRFTLSGFRALQAIANFSGICGPLALIPGLGSLMQAFSVWRQSSSQHRLLVHGLRSGFGCLTRTLKEMIDRLHQEDEIEILLQV